MTVDVQSDMAKTRANGSASLEKQWMLAMQRLASTGLDDAALNLLLDSCSSPSVVSRLARLLAGDAENLLRTIKENCDASAHDLPQWMDALDILYSWLEKHSRTAELSHALGYLSCCSAAAPDAKLPWSTSQMLDQYGMDKLSQ